MAQCNLSIVSIVSAVVDVDVDIKLLLVAFYEKSIEIHGDGQSQFASSALVRVL